MTPPTILRPPFVNVPLAVGLKWPAGGGLIFQEKLDGRWCVQEHARSILVGELVRSTFTAFDVVQVEGQDVQREPLRVRLELLRGLDVPVVAQGQGGEFLEAVLARGGEGVVAKHLDEPYGAPWHKCKRVETFDLMVTEKAGGRSSIRLAAATGEDRGWCACRRHYDHLNVGDVVEVAAMCITAKGKLREPRFLRVRFDKVPLATGLRWSGGGGFVFQEKLAGR